MQIHRTTELDAVNTMLATIGEAPVSTLDGALHVDAVGARITITRITKQVQSEGWYFNTEHNYQLTPNTDGEINLPDNIISVDIEPLSGKNIDVITRGRKLYDLKNHTYTFTETLKATVVLTLPFEELPETAKEYVICRAARKYQTEFVGSDTLDGFSKQDEYNTRVALMRENNKNIDANYLCPHKKSRMGLSTINRVTDRRI